MSLKLLLSSLGCLMAWVVLLPIGLIGSAVALIAYALLADLFGRLTGAGHPDIDPSTARRLAMQLLYPRPTRFRTHI